MVKIEANRIGFFINKKWNITSWYEDKNYKSLIKFTAKARKIGWKLEYTINNRKYTIKETSMLGISPKVYNDKDQLAAECKDPLLSDNFKVNIYSDDVNIYEIFLICYLLFLIQ